MKYPVAKVLALLETSRKTQGDDLSPDYERLLGALLDYEQQETQWRQSAHSTLIARAASHTLRSGNTDETGTALLGAGDSLFWSADTESGYRVEVTLYRALSPTDLRLKGSVLLTPESLQIDWKNVPVLIFRSEMLIDMARLDAQGDFEMTLLDTIGRFHLELRLSSGETMTLPSFALTS